MIDTLRKDPRKRNLAILAAIALVSVLLAMFALAQQAAETGSKYQVQTFFPHLPGQAQHIARIHIVSRQHGAFDVAFNPRKGWVLPQHSDYPVSFEQLRSTVVGIAALQTVQPETAEPDWFHYIGVDGPPKGDGVLIELQDEKGNSLARLIAGKTTDIGDPGGAVGLYVRKPDSNQSWLARSVFEPKSDPADWLDKNILLIDRARIQSVDVVAANGPSYSVHRDKPSDADFAISPIPAGREPAYAGAGDPLAGAVTGFTFDDVKPATALDFSDAQRVVTKTFDGLTVTVQIVQNGGAIWATLYAEAAPGKPDAAREAREIDAHADGWAYRLPAYKGQLFMTTLDSLLKPLAPAKK